MPEQKSPIQVYIENAQNNSIGGFTIPLPTDAEKINSWLEAIESDGSGEDIVIRDIRSPLVDFADVLEENVSANATGKDLEELNYLAARICSMSEYELEVFEAAIETGHYEEGIYSLINLADNLNKFDLMPAFSDVEYGEIRLEHDGDLHAETIARLKESENHDDRDLVLYILKS